MQLLIWTSPLGHKFIKYHFKPVLFNPVLIINLEDYIFYTFSLFLLYFGSDRHVIVVLNSTSSDPESCPVHFQWGQIAILGLNYLCYHCHILCCYFHNHKIFLVYKIYKTKNITTFIFDPLFFICFRIVLVGSKYQNLNTIYPKHLGGGSYSKLK